MYMREELPRVTHRIVTSKYSKKSKFNSNRNAVQCVRTGKMARRYGMKFEPIVDIIVVTIIIV